jgi:membrane-bound lytic murein transglycosylase MltF
MSFEVAMRALLADADRWNAISEQLTTVSSGTSGLYLSSSAFSFAGGDAAAAYEEVRTFVQEFCTAGATKTKGAADALEHVHDVYSSTDEAAKAALEEKWKWL